ncbi:MAG: hypothetical protein ACK5AZ_18880 [Bryobacteraceae bacterium]
MAWMNQLGGLLQAYTGGAGEAGPERLARDWEQIYRFAPREVLTQAVAHTFRSGGRPFPEQVRAVVERIEGGRADILNILLAPLPTAEAGEFRAEHRVLSDAEANLVVPKQVEAMARNAEARDPSIPDQVAELLARHPTMLARAFSPQMLRAAIAWVAERAGAR